MPLKKRICVFLLVLAALASPAVTGVASQEQPILKADGTGPAPPPIPIPWPWMA
ncbi:MAG: hypothetical protein L0387_39575 [Acidobacteria bacterium]|nr:hypothetical protein [Acidobacteriota bacterium]MCI0722907.1 hypothetical protein [Acidobacteriota bacterium]